MDLQGLLDRTLAGLGYELVDWEFSRRGLLRVFLDKPGGVSVEDCALASNHLTRLFAVENIDYDRLEVSSPGLDRALKGERDFNRFAGERAQIKLRAGIEGQRNFTGVLRGAADGVLNLEVEGATVTLALADIEKARLVPNI